MALRQTPADLGLDVLLAVHPVASEALAEIDDRRGAVGAQQLVELDNGVGHGGKVSRTRHILGSCRSPSARRPGSHT